jgi:hypothetical protein
MPTVTFNDGNGTHSNNQYLFTLLSALHTHLLSAKQLCSNGKVLFVFMFVAKTGGRGEKNMIENIFKSFF